MRGYRLHPVLARGATYLGDGATRGTLLDLGRYPGLVDGAGVVHGEAYRLDDPELLPVLDREEGYNFDRRSTPVTLGRRRRRAWVYWYCGPRDRAIVIPEGDYRTWRAPRHQR
jgi:gamma-glutamylcyclotransferase (GGCT)/AIG2-like uncharacterized protein YtfP